MNWIKNSIGHLRNIIVHKFWVYYYGRQLNINRWQLLMHDMSKFHPVEFFESVRWYQGDKSPIPVVKTIKGWSKAWMHHKSHNKHHYDYWLDVKNDKVFPVQIPYKYVMEMIADWLAAGRTYNGKSFTFDDERRWWNNWQNPLMHQVTIRLIEKFFSIENPIEYWRLNERIIKLYYNTGSIC